MCRASSTRSQPAPGPHHPLDVRRRAVVREVQQPGLGLGGGDAAERADLGVGDFAALHRPAEAGQRLEGLGDAHLLARRAQVDARPPVQPVGARQEAGVPAGLRVELAEQDQEVIGGGVQARGQLRDRLAELLDRRGGRERGEARRGSIRAGGGSERWRHDRW